MLAMNEIHTQNVSPIDRAGIKSLPLGGVACDLGYVIGGCKPGPDILVAGYRPVADKVFDRLLKIPSLPWLRGTLYLIRLEALADTAPGSDIAGLSGKDFDKTIILPLSAALDGEVDLIAESYQRVLGMCAELGMIQGRGLYQRRSDLR